MANDAIHVVKVGGSLLDLPDLRDRLQGFLREHGGPRVLLVVGGGRAADVVRLFDRHGGLSETDGHWLAIRAMQLNAHCLAAVLPGAKLVADDQACRQVWRDAPADGEALAPLIMAPFPWLQRDETQGAGIPHRWTFTSDSIAAHVATRLAAQTLTLLKSTGSAQLTPLADLRDAAEAGLVDADLPDAAARLPRVQLVNLRNESFVGKVAR